jgi:hypothetical protein
MARKEVGRPFYFLGACHVAETQERKVQWMEAKRKMEEVEERRWVKVNIFQTISLLKLVSPKIF